MIKLKKTNKNKYLGKKPGTKSKKNKVKKLIQIANKKKKPNKRKL